MPDCLHCSAKLSQGKLKCGKCGKWSAGRSSLVLSAGSQDGALFLSQVDPSIAKYRRTGPWDVNFADPPGIPDDAVILLSGAPGVGKSTISIQLCDALVDKESGKYPLYLGAEESKNQVRSRADRLKLRNLDQICLLPLERMGEARMETLMMRPLSAVVVDSIPTFAPSPDEAVILCKQFKEFAEHYRVPFIVINHMTKDGDAAGLEKLQHAVDITVMADKDEEDTAVYLSDDPDKVAFSLSEMRCFRTEKSRYGPSGVETFYAMTAEGLLQVEIAEEEEGDE
jgi:DNA repair protein RadA/Sms